MARRDRERAYTRRLALIQRLGGKCVDCGTAGSRKNPLEIDHVDGRTYDVARLDPSWRQATYEREFREGVRLEVRCRKHNANAHKTSLKRAPVVR